MKTYTVLSDTPRLGKAGATVTLTDKAAKYWRLAGVIEEVAAETAKPKTTAKKAGK